MEAQGFVKKLGATMVWGRDKEPWSWFFGETNRRYPHSYQVWRPTFDKLLLDNAAAHGVEVRQGWRATQVTLAQSPTPVIPAKAGIQRTASFDKLRTNGMG